MKARTFFYFSIVLLFSSQVNAQSFKVNGKVCDSEGIRLPGTSVYVKGSTTGTITDINGDFSVVIPDTGKFLVCSFIGYITQEFPVYLGMKDLNIVMVPDISALEEVVVIGYGTVKKSCLTGSVVSVSAERTRRVVPGSKTESAPVKIKGAATGTITEPAPAENWNNRARLLTSGEINDFSKWKLWQDISQNQFDEFSRSWKVKAVDRYTVQLISSDQMPVIDAQVFLTDRTGKEIWSSRTDNTGKAELWNAMADTSNDKVKFMAKAIVNNREYELGKVKKFQKGINFITIEENFIPKEQVDIAFVVDATGSMSDEIEYLKTELNDIMLRVNDTLKDKQVNLGAVFYRDAGDEYVTRFSDFSDSITRTVNFVKDNYAGGGGDFPEAVDEALHVTINSMSWHTEALARIVFLVLDAPPHNDSVSVNRIARLTREAARKGIRIVPVTCSGIDKSTEYLMRTIALMTNGTYVFLTDDSGIGNPHIKPTTDEYKVELLNDLIVRLICQYTHVPQKDSEVLIDKADSNFTSFTDKVESNDLISQVKSEQINWKYYPNPTRGLVYVEADTEIGLVYLTDLSGKILERKAVNAKDFSIDLSKYPVGIYLICYEYAPDQWVKGKILLVQ